MLLCLDVGNSHIHGGLFHLDKCIMQFRYATDSIAVTSDQIGVFLRQVIKENDYNPDDIKHVAIGSVVPSINYSLRAAIIKYLHTEPFILQAGVKTGLKIKYPHPQEIGADMIAGAIAGIHQFPNRNLIIIDMGTATVVNPITAKGEFLGAVIVAGMKSSIHALNSGTSQLPAVNIAKVDHFIGKSTPHCIQAGLYYGTRGALREIINGTIQELGWLAENTTVIATGGFAQIFSEDQLFDIIAPDLLLQGVKIAFEKNQ